MAHVFGAIFGNCIVPLLTTNVSLRTKRSAFVMSAVNMFARRSIYENIRAEMRSYLVNMDLEAPIPIICDFCPHSERTESPPVAKRSFFKCLIRIYVSIMR